MLVIYILRIIEDGFNKPKWSRLIKYLREQACDARPGLVLVGKFVILPHN